MIDPSTLPPRLPDGDPRGVLTFAAPLPEALQVAEDSTQAADADRVHALGVRFQRPATPTERDLLAALGWTDGRGEPPAAGLMTSVRWLSVGVRRREWPTLYPPIPAPEVPPPAPEPEPTPDPAPAEPIPTPDPAPAEDPETEPTTPGGAL